MSRNAHLLQLNQAHQTMRRSYFTIHNLTRAHLIIFTTLYLAFTTFTFLITNAGVDSGREHNAIVTLTTAATIAGPLIGGISRNFQGCCLRASLSIMNYAAPILAFGILCQFIRLPKSNIYLTALRLTLWIAAWFAWFAGGIISFAHALT